jgi:hypothetical protein
MSFFLDEAQKMLISFSVENWKLFRDRVSFSILASRERQHGERVPRLPT